MSSSTDLEQMFVWYVSHQLSPILRPAEFLLVPNQSARFCHVADLVTVELHDVDVVRSCLFVGRLTRAAGTGTGPPKNGLSRYVVAFSIGGKRFHFVTAVLQNHQQAPHPIAVFRQ